MKSEIHTTIIPGTEIMQDRQSHQFIKSNRHHSVLVPQPSDRSDDPMNWKPSWKFAVIGLATFATFAQIMSPLAIAPIFPIPIKELDSDFEGVKRFIGLSSWCSDL